MIVVTGSSAATAYDVWPIWNNAYYTVGTQSITSQNTWVEWVSVAGVSANITSGVWQVWNQATTTGGMYVPRLQDIKGPSAEQMAAAAEREKERRLRLAAAKVIRDEADKRSQALLEEFLSESQRRQFKSERCFEVIAHGSKRRYQIREGWAGNVYVLDEENRKVERLCIHPDTQMPIGDNLLAQKLLLESDEELFRKTANITRLIA